MFDFDLYQLLVAASVWVVPIVLAVTLHEAAHGWVASKLGDNTAKLQGRVTFNPFKHIDLFGTILLPAAMLLMSGGQYMFGFAKPVPVNFNNLRRPRRDMILVAAAGPGTNILIAVAAALLLHLGDSVPDPYKAWITMNLFNALWINVVLAVFNLIPLPPLDGGRIAVGLLPPPFSYWLARVERFGFLVLIFVLFALPWIGGKIGVDLNVLWWLVGVPAQFLTDIIATVTGLK